MCMHMHTYVHTYMYIFIYYIKLKELFENGKEIHRSGEKELERVMGSDYGQRIYYLNKISLYHYNIIIKPIILFNEHTLIKN